MVYARDANGNVLGGVRTPHVDAPVAAWAGWAMAVRPHRVVLRHLRYHRPVHGFQLTALYPTHRQFVQQWDLAAVRDLTALTSSEPRPS